MKNIGSLIKKYNDKQIISLLYLTPCFLLLVGIIATSISMFKAPETERTYYYIGIVILIVLVVILLAARISILPKYFFELHQNGIKIVYKKNKIPNDEIAFDEISEIWNISTNGGKKANYLAFKTDQDKDYKLISPKYNDYKGLMQRLTGAVVESNISYKNTALTHGERLVFPILSTDGETVLTSEKAILPYLQQSKKEHLSLDRFSIFDGLKTYSLSDIKSVNLDLSSACIVIESIAGTVLFTQNYFAVCNADLFLALMKDMEAHPTEKLTSEA